MAKTYISALFDQMDSADAAKRALAGHSEIVVHRAFVIHRDAQGFHVDGRFAAEPPHGWIDQLTTAIARLTLGSSREEDAVAVSDAEAELSVGQSALVALIDDRVPDVTDRVIHDAGGTMIRVAPGTLDAEDRERFFDAASIVGVEPGAIPRNSSTS